MESTRQKKVSRLIQKELSLIFQSISSQYFSNVIISVTIVRISKDLSIAKIFISIFPVNDPKIILDKINNKHIMIRKMLAQKTRNQLRKVPELIFYLDDSSSYAENIDQLLKK